MTANTGLTRAALPRTEGKNKDGGGLKGGNGQCSTVGLRGARAGAAGESRPHVPGAIHTECGSTVCVPHEL